MDKSGLDKCVRWIHDERVKGLVIQQLKDAPDYFWTIPASSTGKYHPKHSLGEGGLVRHTRVAVQIALEMIDGGAVEFTPIERDIILAALILHDTWKQGDGKGKHSVDDHARIAALKVCGEEVQGSIRARIRDCIWSHMGRWNKAKSGEVVAPTPKDEVEWFVHMCDYMSSRKCFDINFDNLKV